MGFFDRLWNGPLETREIVVDPINPNPLPPIEDQISALWHRRYPWAAPTVKMALGVPAVMRAVTLLANTGGSLPIDCFRDGDLVDPQDAPSVIRRPDPLNSPRSFKRNTIFNLACYGEAIWWIPTRDFDGIPTSVLNLHPPDVVIRWDEKQLRPIFEWRERDITRDVQHLTYLRFGNEPRGFGPLQVCGSVMSAAAEAAEWAARFMAEGGIPSVVLNWKAGELTANEADALKSQWVSSPSNMPKVVSGGLEVEAFQVSPREAQLIDVREQSAGDVARMFGINPALLGVASSGSSLTYQNVGDMATELLRLTLGPNFLAPIEEALTDLLPRTTVARFNVDALQRADIGTRFDVYASGIASGVLTIDEAREAEFSVRAGVSPPNRVDRLTGVP